MAGNIAAIFDLDGTLFDGHVWFGVVHYHRSQKVNRRWLYTYLAVHFPLWYLHKLRLISQERARYLWARNMAWTLRGFDQAQAETMFVWIADQHILPRLRPDVVERLHDHQVKGHRVMLLSGAFEGLLAVVGQRLGVREFLGTRLKQRKGRYVGAPEGPVCQGAGKNRRLHNYLSKLSEPIDLSASYAYADSITDVPLLKMVGHPVVVYPEEALATMAHRRGWSIVGSAS